MDDLITHATPAEYFAHPPYKAEVFSEVSDRSWVANKYGANCLTFGKAGNGRTTTDFKSAEFLADLWNKKGK